jgi:GT2 family glycosyltransferase
MIQTSIVILNWNTRHQLATFLPILIKYTDLSNSEIIIADNASTDDSVPYVREHFPNIRIIQLDKNYGFAEGYNRALKEVQSEYYVLLNSDIEVTENWLPPLVNLLESDSEIAACMPKFLSYSNRDHFEYAGAAGGYIDYLGYPFCKGRIFDALEKDENQFDGIYEVFWATGACLVIRSALFHSLEGFDPFFFAHMEEIDLCWRLQNEGHKIYCTTQSSVYHIGGGTLPKGNPRKTYLNFRNNLILLYKNMPQNKRYILYYRYFLNMLSIGKYISIRMFEDAWAVFRAYFGYTNYVIHHGKRKKVRTYPKAIYPNSIVNDFFLHKKGKFSELNWKNQPEVKKYE